MWKEDSLVARELVGGHLPQSREIRKVYQLRCKGWLRVKAAETWRASVNPSQRKWKRKYQEERARLVQGGPLNVALFGCSVE